MVDYETKNPKGIMWHKLDMIESVIRGGKHDWIWWIDFDTLFTNHATKVADVIEEALANSTTPNEINILLTPDWYSLSLRAVSSSHHVG